MPVAFPGDSDRLRGSTGISAIRFTSHLAASAELVGFKTTFGDSHDWCIRIP